MTTVPAPTYDEVFEFLLASPSPQEIIEFRPSPATQERVSALLDANRQGSITEDEQHELDEFAQLEHFVRMLKIKAREKLDEA